MRIMVDSKETTYGIVVPAFQAEATIARALRSVLAQSLDAWSLVVVDDGSSDRTLATASEFSARDGRVTVVAQTHAGVAAARNRGISLVEGTHVCFLDADDELSSDYLAEMDTFIRNHPGHDIYHPNLRVVDKSGDESLFALSSDVKEHDFGDLLEECVIAVGGAVVTKSLLESVGGFRTGVHAEDYDLWLRATSLGHTALYSPKPLYVYHLDRRGRRSEDAVAGAHAVLDSLADLLDAGVVLGERRSDVEAALRDRRAKLARISQEQVLARQADLLQRALEDLLGRRSAAVLLPHVRSAAKVVRPLRVAVAEGAARRDLVRAARRRVVTRRSVLAADEHPAQRALRVLVIPSWYPSRSAPGAGVFIREQVRALSMACDVAVLYAEEARMLHGWLDRIAPHSIAAAIRLVVMRLRYAREGLAAFEQLRANWGTPDIVHVQALWPAALLARAINRRYGIPYVVTEHSEEYLAASRRRMVRTPGVVPLVLRPLARGGERTIAVSGHLAQRLGELGLAVRPIVIPNVVPTYESALRPQGGRRGIAHVSVMGPAKNLRSLLRAAERLRHRRIDFVVRLVGDGESRAELERMAAALELTGTFVEFVGRLDAAAVREQFAAASFTVVCSTHETFSVVAAESLMCGRPVLSTRCGGPEEFIDDTVGRLIPVDDVEALVEGLDWMLDHSDEFDPRALHDYAAARFAPEVVARQITAVYEEALRDR